MGKGAGVLGGVAKIGLIKEEAPARDERAIQGV